jgi:hypothetical protein
MLNLAKLKDCILTSYLYLVSFYARYLLEEYPDAGYN